MNIKKLGLTALAGSMVALSATAGELTVTGSMNMTYSTYSGNQDDAQVASGIGIENAVFATGSTELDNGFVVSYTQGINASDSTYLSVDMGDLGSLSYSQDDAAGGLEALDDKMPAAYEESWDGADGPASFSDANSFYYSNGNLADGITLLASYAPGGNGNNKGSTSIGATITAIDGLTIGLAVGNDNGSKTNETDYTVAYATYAMGPITVGVQMNDQDQTTTALDEEMTMVGLSYAVSEDMTVSYGYSELDYELSTKPTQEASAVGVSYTMGSIGFVGSYHDIENASGATGDTANYKEYEIGLTFAF